MANIDDPGRLDLRGAGAGGGGGPVTIIDGGSAAMGSTTDTAATTDTGIFSLIALFKRFLAKLTSGINVGGYTDSVVVTPTITAGAYVSGDSLGGKLTLANAVRVAAGSGVLQSITVTDKAKKNNAIDFLFFIAGDPAATTFTDHAQLTVNATDLLNCKVVSFPASQYVSLATNSVGTLPNIGIRFKLTTGTTLYAAAVARGTVAPASTSDLQFRFACDLDA